MKELPASRMTTARNHIVTLCFLAIFLALNSLAYPQILTHTFHHSHHTADTHSTPLCFWVCSAGQMEEASSPFFPAVVGLAGIIVLSTIGTVLLQFQFVRLARGPPSVLRCSSNRIGTPTLGMEVCSQSLTKPRRTVLEHQPLAWRCVHFPNAKASLQEV